MNQHRWTCLTTIALTTVLAPTASVQAKSLVFSGTIDSTATRSLPNAAPLASNGLQRDGATQTVPAVSQLPIVNDSLDKFAMQSQLPTLPTTALHSAVSRLRATKIGFNPNFKAIDTAATTPRSTVPTITPIRENFDTSKFSASTATTTRIASTLIPVERNTGIPSTPIILAATAQAEIANESPPIPRLAPLPERVATNAKIATVTSPQFTPVTIPVPERAETPSFASGSPVFVFENDRPQQIVTTTIAQVDDRIVAQEPSIAIPIQRPKQDLIPTAAVPDRPIVTTDEPTEIAPTSNRVVSTITGLASWYGGESGARTANGERYDPSGLTAAHPNLPFDTKVRVTSIKTGKVAIVRINDRGPFHSNRIIDVSAGAAMAIGIKNDGIGKVKLEVLTRN